MTERIFPPDSTDVWGLDDSRFDHASLPELVEAYGDSLEVGQEVFVGEAIAPDLEELVDVEGILEDLQDRATQRYGECAEDWLGAAISQDARAELAELLADWIQKHAPPDFYGVRNSRGHVLTEQDFEVSGESLPLAH